MTNDILALLIAERDKLNRAIEALKGSPIKKRRGRPPKSATSPTTAATKPRRGRKGMSKAARKAQSERMKKFWAKRQAKS